VTTFSIGLYPWDNWIDLHDVGAEVQHAESLGFHAVNLPEHLVTPITVPPLEIGTTWPEIYVLGGYLAALTSRIRLHMVATVVPYRHPIHLAKQVATLDQLSNGRLTLVVGSGWLASEFEALGVDFDGRGELLDDFVRAMVALWTESQPSFSGRHVKFKPVEFSPRCVQRPHVPLWIGGDGPRTEGRLFEFGAGWRPMGGTPDELGASIDLIRRRAVDAERNPAELEFAAHVSLGDKAIESTAVSDLAAAYTRAGLTHLAFSFGWTDRAEFSAKLEQLAAAVLSSPTPRTGN
jgi:probable F420-dependent oxidoreductase